MLDPSNIETKRQCCSAGGAGNDKVWLCYEYTLFDSIVWLLYGSLVMHNVLWLSWRSALPE